MRKRLLTLALAGALLLGGCAAAADRQREADSYALYFREADLSAAAGGDALRAETIYLDHEEDRDTRQTAEWLVQELLKGPLDETLKSTIPAGTSLLSLEVADGRALVDLSAPYGTLSGVGLTLADYAITLTLTQLPDIRTVGITVRGRELAYRDRQSFMERDVLLTPQEDVVGTVPAVLYFPDTGGQLTAEARTLDLYEGDTQVAAVVRALENGPESKDLSPALPEGFRVKSVWLEEDACYVNLSSALLAELPPDTVLSGALRALASSLCSLDAVGEVRFLVDGEFAQVYGGVLIGAPYTES